MALTAPYMHTGGFTTLDEVVDFYNGGGEAVPGKDAFMSALSLTGDLTNMAPPKLP